jgi:hypothetical protein
MLPTESFGMHAYSDSAARARRELTKLCFDVTSQFQTFILEFSTDLPPIGKSRFLAERPRNMRSFFLAAGLLVTALALCEGTTHDSTPPVRFARGRSPHSPLAGVNPQETDVADLGDAQSAREGTGGFFSALQCLLARWPLRFSPLHHPLVIFPRPPH